MTWGVSRRRWGLVFAGMVIVLLLSCCVTPPPDEEKWPSWAPDSQRVVYECYRDGPADTLGLIDRLVEPNGDLAFYSQWAADLCVSDVSTGVESRLISDRGGNWQPSWSPDGTLIAYLRSDGIYLTTPEGEKPRRLTETRPGETGLAWSPTSDRLLFSACEYEDHDVYILEIESGALNNLTSSRSTHDFSPMWILGGTQVAYLSIDNTSSYRCDIDIPAAPEFRVMNVNGTSDRVILAPEYPYPYWYLSAANGSHIWYANQTLFRLDAVDGTVVRELAPSRRAIVWPQVTPNEERLIYQEERDQVRMLNRYTDKVSTVIEGSPDLDASLVPLAWSPDSKKFVVLTSQAVDFRSASVERLYVFDLQDRTLQPLGAQD